MTCLEFPTLDLGSNGVLQVAHHAMLPLGFVGVLSRIGQSLHCNDYISFFSLGHGRSRKPGMQKVLVHILYLFIYFLHRLSIGAHRLCFLFDDCKLKRKLLSSFR